MNAAAGSKKRLVQFGAGNIGRSFIGQVFSNGGYEVIFIDINDTIVDELNRRGEYRVIVKKNEEPDEVVMVSNVRAVHGSRKEEVIGEITESDLIATSVGQAALPHIFQVIAEGIKRKKSLDKHIGL